MTNEEKLRALLAEARREHDGDANIGACGTDNDGNDTRCDRCQRIDAALAEPVLAPPTNYYAEFDAMRDKAAKYGLEATQMRKERDEARAEVRRTYKELSESIAREAEAYERGAEAMREATVGAAVERARYWTEASAAEGGITSMEDRAEEAQLTADDIRDLPVPEDKP